MKIESVRIQNFRGFHDQTIMLDNYTALVGPNGAGKSTVLSALNVFFRQFKDSKTDLSKLSVDDFHHKNVQEPIRVTVTFADLSEEAKQDLSAYVRQDKLIVSSVAEYDPNTGRAEVRQYGNRMGMEEFRRYFEADKEGASAKELASIFASLKEARPEISSARTKEQMEAALHSFEANHPDLCSLIPSEDQFYGATRGASRLSPHVQWIFVPAAKDITQEADETKDSALGQLLARTIRAKIKFSEEISGIRNEIQARYQEIIDSKQGDLDEISLSIEVKLKQWSHPNATAKVKWVNDAEKSIKVDEPWASIVLGERGFEGGLARFGHGMQRSYMLTLLQELSQSVTDGPTLVMAIEEPELYQHPPQVRYLASLLQELAEDEAQVLVCTHSPHFIPGDSFDQVRLIRESGNPVSSCVASISYADLAKKINDVEGKELKESGILAKLYPSINPSTSEMFFCRYLVLVEGAEDVAYLLTCMALDGLLSEFRRAGGHVVPVGGKSEIVKPLAIAKMMGIPVFVVADADTNKTKDSEIVKHKKDNRAILDLLGHDASEWPDRDLLLGDAAIWKTNLTDKVSEAGGTDWSTALDKARAYYGNAPDLTKNPLTIARALAEMWKSEKKIIFLQTLCAQIIAMAGLSEAAASMPAEGEKGEALVEAAQS